MKTLPKNRPLTDLDINKFATKYIKDFRSVFMRHTRPKRAKKRECAVVNLDSVKSAGTHWVAYIKHDKNVRYFVSFGNLLPPKELVKYLSNCEINYNYHQYQSYNLVNCGNLCITFLLDASSCTNMSYTFTINGSSSVLEGKYYPPIHLQNDHYCLALIGFYTYNTIPNIEDGCNKFYYDENKVITIPTGSYEISDIEDYLREQLKRRMMTRLKIFWF